MYIYRCTFILIEFDNITTNMFIRCLDKESAELGSNKIFKEQCVKHSIPNAKFIQEVRLSSEDEMAQYTLDMKNNVQTRTMVN